MKLEKAIVFSILFAIGCATLGLVLSGQLSIAHRLLYAAGFLTAAGYHALRMRWPRWVFNAAALAVLAGCMVYGLWFAEYPILAAIYFVGYIIILRAFELESSRDFKLAALLSLFEIAAASLVLISPWFFALVAAWLVSVFFSLNLITIYSRSSSQQPLKALGRLILLDLLAASFSLVFGVALFFFLPRIGFSLVSLPVNADRSWSGYSSTIKLGKVSELLENRTPVMRIHVDRDSGVPGVKWRMRAMEYFDRGEWQDLSGMSKIIGTIYNQPTTVNLHPPAGVRLTQEIYLEPGFGPELPAASVAYAYQVPYYRFRTIICSPNDYCSLPFISYERVHYLAYSLIPDYTTEQISSALKSFPQFAAEKKNKWVNRLLQLPSGSDQICRLAEDVAGGETDPARKIEAVRGFLEKNYKYSLSGLPTGPEAISDFLFRSKTGNCEYFATAGALMLRCQKIPNRLAAGFIAGEWSASQDYYLVRGSDAHVWVEIYLPGLGYVDFDPTPAAGRERRSTSSPFWRLWDPVNFRWNRWIVEYSVQDQLRGLRRMRAESVRAGYEISFRGFEFRSWLRSNPVIAVLVMALVLFAAAFWFRAKDRRGRRKQLPRGLSGPERMAAEIYLRMLELLKRKDLAPTDSSTGYEAAERVRNPAAKVMVRAITAFYYRVRFGKAPASEQDLARARAELKLLKKRMSSTWE